MVVPARFRTGFPTALAITQRGRLASEPRPRLDVTRSFAAGSPHTDTSGLTRSLDAHD